MRRIHNYDPELKQQSKHWKHANSPSPWKFKLQALAGKIISNIFQDVEGGLPIDFMPQKVTIMWLYYADLLHKLHIIINEKRRGKLTQVSLLLHDNASVRRFG